MSPRFSDAAPGGLVLVSSLFEDDLDVLSLLPDVRPEAPPVFFGASRWDLTAVSTWPAYSHRTAVLWDSIDNPKWRVAAKEAAVLLMCPRLAVEHHLPFARRAPLPPWSLPYAMMSYWRRWLNFLTAEGVSSLRTVTQAHCDAFIQTLKPKTRHIAITAMRAFADYGPVLTYDEYPRGFRPFGDKTAAAASAVPRLGRSENRTPPIPDRVLAPLLAACLHLVENVAPDVAAATEHRARLQAVEAAPHGGRAPDFDSRLDEYLSTLRRQGRPVPALDDRSGINLGTVALHLGMRERRSLQRADRQSKLLDAARELGTAPGGLYGVRPRVEFTPTSLGEATHAVRTACLVVVAALSGMRHSELAEILRGAWRREEPSPGQVRFRIESKLLKGQPPGGKREVWTAIEPVITALRVAESLTTGRHPITVEPFSRKYPQLVQWVNDHANEEGLQIIPTDWQLEPRQFRRTLSRELAWRPGGVIAGKIHLKHISVVTTEGYAGAHGESARAFLAEVEAERRVRNRETAQRAVAEIERGAPVAGRGAKALTQAVSEVLEPGPVRGPQVRDRDDALKSLVRARADTLHVTPLVYCWFTNPEAARCLRHARDKSQPLIAACRPELCANATVHAEHVPAWISGLDALRATIADRRVPDGERSRLHAKAAEMQAIVSVVQRGR
jgi:integrase